ncbi:hypothetical protein FRX31_011975 [Thalictrum thalictroides]|uniref:Uncharacterized protein n=1 Tax=Thalictrum thalictroides TaxID=46969 RepID=A0A7J6WNB7_THATH|nr:hypothetical protein FRX31_011975 [Thalictrum thalictroides]
MQLNDISFWLFFSQVYVCLHLLKEPFFPLWIWQALVIFSIAIFSYMSKRRHLCTLCAYLHHGGFVPNLA